MRGMDIKEIIEQSDYDVLVDVAAESSEKTADMRETDSALPNLEKSVLLAGGASGVDMAFEPTDHLKPLADRWRHMIKRSKDIGSVARMLQVSAHRVRDMDDRRQLHSFQLRNEPRYPLWQFDSLQTIPHLDTLLSEISPGVHPLSLERFMCRKTPDLEDPHGKIFSPRQWLINGWDPAPVLSIARDI